MRKILAKKIFVATLTILILTQFIFSITVSSGESIYRDTYTVLIDLTRVNNFTGLDALVRELLDGRVYILLRELGEESNIDPSTRNLITIAYGSLSNFTLANKVLSLDKLSPDIVIIPINTENIFRSDEIDALKRYLSSGEKILWISASYSENPRSVDEADRLLALLGSSLAIDYTYLVANKTMNREILGASVRVTIKNYLLTYGVEKILTYAPSPVALFNSTTNTWRPLTESEAPSGINIMLLSSSDALVPREAPRGNAYNYSSNPPFPLMVSETMPIYGNSTLVVSGSLVVGGYAPMATWRIGSEYFDGPRFLRNLVLLLSGYYGELRFFSQINSRINSVVSDTINLIGNLSQQLSVVNGSLSTEISDLRNRVDSYDQKINDAKIRAENLSAEIAYILSRLDETKNSINSLSNYVYAGLGVAVIALVISVLILFLRKR